MNMFIKVRYGDDETKLFNPNCRNRTLLDNIKLRCRCKQEDVLELSDEEGTVKHLQEHLDAYGTSHFTDRETLVLLRVNKIYDSFDERIMYVPMLQSFLDNKVFLEKINPKQPTSARGVPTTPTSKVRIRTNPADDKGRHHSHSRQRRRSSVSSPGKKARRGSITN